jgi:hypothetical protein
MIIIYTLFFKEYLIGLQIILIFILVLRNVIDKFKYWKVYLSKYMKIRLKTLLRSNKKYLIMILI